MRQPAIFFGHGSPMNALGGPYADAWRALGEAVGKPKGVVMISAHWETRGLGVTAQEPKARLTRGFLDRLGFSGCCRVAFRFGRQAAQLLGGTSPIGGKCGRIGREVVSDNRHRNHRIHSDDVSCPDGYWSG